ncbi:MAG: HlyD family secretion protein [Candidatus Eremiobacteraeota bacterium]|nr:HlyD family secretion protein [Candidatus Eremiobacteraeota bacterium]
MDSQQRDKMTAGGDGHANGAGLEEAQPEKSTRGFVRDARRPLIALVLGILIVALLLWGLRYFAYARAHQSTDDARIDTSQVSVTSKISERVANIPVATNQHVRRGQVLIQLDDTDERARVSEAQAAVDAQRATAAAAEANVGLTAQTQRAQSQQGVGGIQTARASIASAQQQAKAAAQQVPVAQAAVGVAVAQLAEAQAALPGARENWRRAQADLRRTRSLVGSGDLPRAQLDAARAAEAQARSQWNAAQDQVAVARETDYSAQQKVAAQEATANSTIAGIGVAQGSLTTAAGRLQESSSPDRVAASQAQANAASASVGNLNAHLQLVKNQLAATRITSPTEGYVGQKNVEIGQTVTPGNTLLTIIPSRDIFITAFYKETQVGTMRPNQSVEIKVDAYKGVAFHGHVLSINPASQNTYSIIPPQNASGNFVKVTQRIPVRISIDNPDPNLPLRPGMSVETSVKIQ